MIKLNKALEAAILKMPTSEKDKLLLRLVRKDPVLVDQLAFKLLGSAKDQKIMYNKIIALVDDFVSSSHGYETPGYIMMDMRSVSGEITYYYKLTKDKIGIITLNLYMLKKMLAFALPAVDNLPLGRSIKMGNYAAKRLLDMIAKVEKLHPDLHMDFREDIKICIDLLYGNEKLAFYAKKMNVPKTWQD